MSSVSGVLDPSQTWLLPIVTPVGMASLDSNPSSSDERRRKVSACNGAMDIPIANRRSICPRDQGLFC